MKRSISLVLCLAVLISVFSCVGVTASAAGNAKELFTVKAGEFKNDEITYTVYLKKGVSVLGSIVYAKFDSQVLKLVESGTGPCMVKDSYGDESESIIGVYEQGFMDGFDNQYSIGHVYGTEKDYKAGSSNKAYMQFKFKVKGGNRPKTTVKFYCYEFNSESDTSNNIANGSNSLIYSHTVSTLAKVNLKSVEATVTGVKIKWDKVADAESYKLYRKIGDGSWKEFKTVASSKNYYTDTGASSGKTMSYKVVAVNGDNTSESGSKSVYYLKTPTVSLKNKNTGVYVSWKKVNGASSYDVYRKAGSASSWTKIATTKSTSYTDKKAKSGTNYKYTIRAVGSKGKSKYGSTAYETIRFLAAPKLEKITSTKSGVTIYWDNVKGATKYFIYRKTGSGDYKLIKTVSGAKTVKYLDKSAKKGKTYTYKVYAGYGDYKSGYKSTLKIKDKY